jgi:trimeric autotransporter adhesin
MLLCLAGLADPAGASTGTWTTIPLPGMNGTVLTAVEFDDGTGPALYVGGTFTGAGSVAANYVARWNGQQWSAMGNTFSTQVNTLAVYTPAGGTANLYAGGSFGVKRWDGQQWLPLPSITGGSALVSTMAVFDDDGTGPNPPYLMIGGAFTSVGGAAALNVAKWDGTTLSPGPGISNGNIQSLRTVAATENGVQTLYCGGSGLFKLTGTSWSDYAWTNTSLTTSLVKSLCQYTPPGSASPLLVCGGDFTKKPAPGMPGNRIAGYNGLAATAIGTGAGMDSTVFTLATLGGPSGLLIAGGAFNTVDGVSLPKIACWDGTAWSGILGGITTGGSVRALTAVHLQGQLYLAVGGSFSSAPGSAAGYIWLLQRQLPVSTDINGDGTVNVIDLLFLADSWGKSAGDTGYDYRCDLNGDNTVNTLDLLVLAGDWGKQNNPT